MSSRIKRTKTLQPAAESSKQARKLIEVVPDGDVLLKVGQEAEALDIRVSGLVISLASDMFSRMLSSSFTEASTKVIELKDDDPEVVLDFCNIAHHKIENLDHCNGLRLLKLAELADARFCERVLRPWVATTLYSALSALEKWERDKTDVTVYGDWISPSSLRGLNIVQCLGVAMVFQLDELFWLTTKYSILCTPRFPSEHHQIPSFAESALRSGQLSLQEVLKQSHKRLLHDFLNDVFKCVGEDFETGAVCGSIKRKRACSFSKYGAFMLYLARENIKPGQSDDYRGTLSEAMNVILLLSQRTNRAPWGSILAYEDCTKGLAKPCRYCLRDIMADLLRLVQRYIYKVQGVCLSCYRDGKEEFFHRTCPIQEIQP